MRLTLRAKVVAIVVTAAMSFAFTTISGMVAANRVTQRMTRIREHYVPRVELRPRLEGEFERMRRGMQDAVASQDLESLSQTRDSLRRFDELLESAHSAFDPALAAELRQAVEDYHTFAYDVSRRLIEQETGEALIDAMTSMQSQQVRVIGLIDRTTALEQNELEDAFSSAISAQESATRWLFWTSIVALIVTILLSWRMSRGVLRSVAALTRGFERFGRGDFHHRIATVDRDELADVGVSANEMARSLAELGNERQRDEWLKAGHAGLSQELRGELELSDVGTRALSFIARHLDAPVGALYFLDDGDVLNLLATFAQPSSDENNLDSTARPSFRMGSGLVGQAALQDTPTIVKDPPPNYLRIESGLGAASPREIVLVPLLQDGKPIGVLELALFAECSDQSIQLLLLARETLAIALQVARSRTAMRELLTATQEQADQLAMQDEELRATNEELQAQQEELRQTNEELTEQTQELEAQHRVVEAKNAELEETRRGLERKATELATVSAYKSQFLANMSHELRTPLNSMLLLSSLLTENQIGNLTPKQVEYCTSIHSAGTDLLALINQVLDLAKVESGKQDVHVEPVQLTPWLSQFKNIFEPQANAKGLGFILELAADLPETISTDRQRITQILNNLLANAIKFTEHGEIRMQATRVTAGTRLRRHDLHADRTVALTISDTGIGIPVEQQERIFEPFEQADPSTGRRYGGTGLGLAIARELAALLGGEIELRSALGKGSTFILYLPCDGPRPKAHEPGDAMPALRVPSTGGSTKSSSSDAIHPRLLVIEDDPMFATALGELIERQGLQCLFARDGETGLRLAKSERPTGIVLDLGLPDMDGWAVVERLSSDPETASIPVHVVSARDGSERTDRQGTIGYLRKPSVRSDLVRMIESLVPTSDDRAMSVLIVGDDAVAGDSLIALLERERIKARRVERADDALRVLATDRFQCMVLDLSLPDMDGLDLLRSLESQTTFEKPAVIVYTARDLSKAETQRLEAYTEAVVLKEGAAVGRLLDEIRLFARQLSDGFPRRKASRSVATTDIRLENRTILVADDDMRTIYALSAMLRSRGAEVLVADTGLAAITMLEEHPSVDGVLMDIMMPEMDGYAAMRRIRADARFQTLPIIALTAKAMRGDEEKCLEAGANAYLPKPIDPHRLLQILGVHLTRSS